VLKTGLLPYSETFIPEQTEALPNYGSFYLGGKRVAGLPLPGGRFQYVYAGKPAFRLAMLGAKLGLPSGPLRKSIEALKPDVLHAHFVSAGIWAAPVAAELGLPLVTTCHGVDVTAGLGTHSPGARLRLLLKKRGLRKLQRTGALFIAVSGYIRAKMMEAGFPAEKIRTLPIGVDVERFAPRDAVRQPVVLFVGRLTEKKGVFTLLQAMAHVWRRDKNVRLVVIGSGPLKEPMERMLREIPFNNVFFAGKQTPEEVREWMSVSSLLCQPSQTAANGDSEGLPIVICEALAMTLPVVSTRHSGIPEAVVHGVSGFLSAERDALEIAANINRLLADKELAAQMGRAGRDYVMANLNLKKQSAKLETLYNEAIATHAHPVFNPQIPPIATDFQSV
jgi:glycosyltransferase involved in cell wall biosynthesis